jgi:hypothetical protein
VSRELKTMVKTYYLNYLEVYEIVSGHESWSNVK